MQQDVPLKRQGRDRAIDLGRYILANRPILISNNPTYLDAAPKTADLRFVDGSALDVLVTARDLAHQGWCLANHPLYGNFRPHQQPYRSLVMLPHQPDNADNALSREPCTPLGLLEEALVLYQSPVRKSRPEDVPEHMRKDCAVIDVELMRATLESLS